MNLLTMKVKRTGYGFCNFDNYRLGSCCTALSPGRLHHQHESEAGYSRRLQSVLNRGVTVAADPRTESTTVPGRPGPDANSLLDVRARSVLTLVRFGCSSVA
jgi:hypothetical protein